jgi:hypothetical protein
MIISMTMMILNDATSFTLSNTTGIVSIMRKATERLEGRQKEKYGNQEKYKTWASKVKAPLFPFLS